MTEEIAVDLKDMETYLELEDYQAFLKAREGVDEYNKAEAEHKKKIADAKSLRDEYRKKMSEARNILDIEFWSAKSIIAGMFPPAPYLPIHLFEENDRYINTVRRKKLEQLAREELKERRLAALREIDPPLVDAKRYLNSQQYQELLDSLVGAADAYLDKGGDDTLHAWRFDARARDYILWTTIIEGRKEEEAREKQAEMEEKAWKKQFEMARKQYMNRLNVAVEKFRKELAKGKETKLVYPTELGGYKPDSWCDLELPTRQQIHNWAKSRILTRVPEILADLTRRELTWKVRALPGATYGLSFGVPRLVWNFESDVVITVNLGLQKGPTEVQIPGDYDLRVEFEDTSLGVFYLGPVAWGISGSFATPIALLSLLGAN